MSTKTLVIVDMQPRFDTSNCFRTRKNVRRLAKLFKAKKWPIVVLEYHGYGDTHEEIMDELRSYENLHRKVKFDDDGSQEVLETNIPLDSVVVCGVNLCACVADTCAGLASKLPNSQITAIKFACNDGGNDLHYRWNRFRSYVRNYANVNV